MQTHLKKHLAVVVEFPLARARVRSQERAFAAITGSNQLLTGNRGRFEPELKAKNYAILMRLAHLSLLQAEILAFKANEQLNTHFEANLV
jgi:hypothetical protein